MPSYLKFILLVCFCLLSHFSKAAEKLNIVSPLWNGYTNKDGSGVYFEILKHVYPSDELSFNVSELHRAKNQLLSGKADILLAVYKEELPAAHFPNWYLDVDNPVIAFYPTQTHTLTKITPLNFNKKSLAWLEGFDFVQIVGNDIQPYLVKDRKSGFKLLLNNRIDYFIDYEHNFLEEYKSKVNFVTLKKGKRLYAAFQNNARGKNLAKQYDQNMLYLRESGMLATIFSEGYKHSKFEKFSPDK